MGNITEEKESSPPPENPPQESGTKNHFTDQAAPNNSIASPASGDGDENKSPPNTKEENKESDETFERGPRFWAIIAALAVTNVVGALEGTVVSTALPTVIQHLGGGELYLWAVNGYFLPNLAFQPLYAQAADIFGRRWPYITAVLLFFIGSTICGAAPNMSVFIFGRVVQGSGGSGLAILGQLVVSDLVPLRQRGAYMALIMIAITIGTGMGPFIGGIIVQSTTWRWVFYLNLPLAGVSLILLLAFLHTGSRKGSALQKLGRFDYIGEAIFISSVTAILIALAYAGTTHPWSSWRTILPLVLGFAGLGAFIAYEETPFCVEPTMPLRLFKNRTTVVACSVAFLHSLINVWVIYFLPIYFQGVKRSSPARSGVQLLPVILFLIPFAAVSGRLLQRFGRYKPLVVAGVAVMVIGLGLFTLLKPSSSMAAWVCFQALEAAGTGLSLSALLPAAQASLEEADTAKITGTFSFIRSFGISFAVTVPGAIFNSRFNNEAYKISDDSVRAELLQGQAYEHATKEYIDSFHDPLRAEIVGVYSDTLKFIWQIALGICGLAFLISLFMKEIEMRNTLKSDFGLQKKDQKEELKEESEREAKEV